MAKKKLSVLICDDESHIRLMLKTLLKTMNVEITGEAKNGEEAVEIFKEKKPHITLLDINMPLKTGVEALKEILDIKPNAFVIMMTSVSDMETVNECITLGASNYILKDTPITEMKEMIKTSWKEYRSG